MINVNISSLEILAFHSMECRPFYGHNGNIRCKCGLLCVRFKFISLLNSFWYLFVFVYVVCMGNLFTLSLEEKNYYKSEKMH